MEINLMRWSYFIIIIVCIFIILITRRLFKLKTYSAKLFRCRSSGPRSAPTKRCKTFIRRNRCWTLLWWRESCSYSSWGDHSLCSFEECSEPDEIIINMCLILNNTLDVTDTVQNKREHQSSEGFIQELLWFNICIVFQDDNTNISDEG